MLLVQHTVCCNATRQGDPECISDPVVSLVFQHTGTSPLRIGVSQRGCSETVCVFGGDDFTTESHQNGLEPAKEFRIQSAGV